MAKPPLARRLTPPYPLLNSQEGTRENPIPILSEQDERIVGITLPVRKRNEGASLSHVAYARLRAPHPPLPAQDDSETRWFTMKAGELAYDPSTQNYFALKIVTKADVQVWLDKAEKDAH